MKLPKTIQRTARLARAIALSGVLAHAVAQTTAPRPVASAPAAAASAASAGSSSTCPPAHEVGPAQVMGLWRVEFSGLWQGATLLIEKHPDYAGSIAGGINRNGERGRVAGDMEDGELTLEESADGQRISATFLGDVVEGSCGKEIRGTWQATGEKAARSFVMKKQ